MENGLLVMGIYADFHCGPGDVLLANNFVAVAARRRVPIGEIQEGLEFALERRWIEKSPHGLRLTDVGYAQIAADQTA